MNNAATLEAMLETIARLPIRDEASIRAAFEDPKPAEVSIGERGIGLTLGQARAAYVTATGHVTGGLANFGSIAPAAKTFVLGEVDLVAPVEPVNPAPVAPGVVVVDGDLPRGKRRESGKGEATTITAAGSPASIDS